MQKSRTRHLTRRTAYLIDKYITQREEGQKLREEELLERDLPRGRACRGIKRTVRRSGRATYVCWCDELRKIQGFSV